MKIIIYTITTLLFLNSCEKNVIADFHADKTQIEGGETVAFYDDSRGDTKEWLWVFEGGEPEQSNEQNPKVTYYDEGIYNVSLTVYGESSSETNAKEAYINVSKGVKASPYVGKWILNSTKKNIVINEKYLGQVSSKRSNLKSIVEEKANIKPYLVEGWTAPLVVKEDPMDDLGQMKNDKIVSGDDMYVSFSFINESNIDITSPFKIKISIDNQEVFSTIHEEGIKAYYYWYYLNQVISGTRLSIGNHVMTLVLDADNNVDEAKESDNKYTIEFTVIMPERYYYSFEFFEDYYLITEMNNDLILGRLKPNGDLSELDLTDYGKIDVIDLQESTFNLRYTDYYKPAHTFILTAVRSEENERTPLTNYLRMASG